MTLSIESSSNRFFTYAIKMDLVNESFKKHKLRTERNGSVAIIESIGFFEYTECVSSCNTFLIHLAKQLSDLTGITHQMAWEANPKLSSTLQNFITPIEHWNEGELVKLYITTSKVPLTFNDLKSCAQASILTGFRDLSNH